MQFMWVQVQFMQASSLALCGKVLQQIAVCHGIPIGNAWFHPTIILVTMVEVKYLWKIFIYI